MLPRGYERELSKREREVAELYAKTALSQKEIASKLFIEVKTLKFHVGNIFKKLQVLNRIELKQSYYDLGHVYQVLNKSFSPVPYPPEGLE